MIEDGDGVSRVEDKDVCISGPREWFLGVFIFVLLVLLPASAERFQLGEHVLLSIESMECLTMDRKYRWWDSRAEMR